MIYKDRKWLWCVFENCVVCLVVGFCVLGVERGNCVVILLFNSDCYLEYFYVVLWVGGVFNFVNICLVLLEIVYSLNDFVLFILFVDDVFSDMLLKLWLLFEIV